MSNYNFIRIPFGKIFLFFILLTGSRIKAQNDTVYHVGLILPFQSQSMMLKLDEIASAHDLYSANRVKFDEDALMSLDFYQGVLQSLKNNSEGIRIELSAYDSWNSDSVTAQILKKPELQKMDFIIGSASSYTAKLVAEFCKVNHILNIQPFTPSKSLTSENPYHLKIAPTIDSHIDNLFQSILDSFTDANIIIYSPKTERSYPVALRFDSLFKMYNAGADVKYQVSLLNTSDQTVNGLKSSLTELISHSKPNILIITSYDEPFVQSTLRTVMEKKGKATVIAYGMPTWLSGDILRLDYINDMHTRISDAFFADTSKTETRNFFTGYDAQFHAEPSKYAYLGFDVMNFLLRSVKAYGKDFLSQIITQRFTGVGYKFDIGQVMKNSTTLNYYENTHVNVLKVQDYRLVRVW